MHGAAEKSLGKDGADVDIRKALPPRLRGVIPKTPSFPPNGFDADNPCLPVSIVSTSVWQSLERWYPKPFGA